MILQDLKIFHEICAQNDISYYTDLFSKSIWGDMGEDCASITIRTYKDQWLIHFIRTQSGEPYPLSETVCQVLDEYEKVLSHEALYDMLSLHRKLDEFENFIKMHV